MQNVEVELGSRSYSIYFGEGDWELYSRHLPLQSEMQRSKGVILIDENIERLYGEQIRSVYGDLLTYIVPAGESSKSWSQVGEILEFMAYHNLDRGSWILSIGGGVTGDLAGFVAAVYLRGIRYFQMPTTLLAMVDSAVGGKTGVNLRAGKNLAGAFLQPSDVFVWFPFLKSLSQREFAAGMAEVIKYAILGDEDLFHLLEKSGGMEADYPSLPGVISRCCSLKVKIVAADEREQAKDGGRALLNLGHTFGHAIEAVSGYGTYLHGEAVSIGLLMAARYAQDNGFLKEDAVQRIRKLLKENHLPVLLREALPVEDLIQAMTRDKKVRAGHMRLVLPTAIGKAKVMEISGDYQLRSLWEEFSP